MKRRKTAFELLAQAPDGKKRKKEKNADVGADGDSISNDGRTESVGYSSDSDDDEDVEDDEDDEPFDGREHYLDVR